MNESYYIGDYREDALHGPNRGWIDGKTRILKAGDYIVIKPRIPNDTVAEILEDAVGITIKAPSDPSAKKIIGLVSYPLLESS